MNKRTLFAVVIAVLVLLGGWYFASNKKSSDKMMGNEEIVEESSSQMSLKDLFMKGISQTCTFSLDDETYKSSGTVYVANGKMRGDFVYQVDGSEQVSHMLVMDETSYIWQDGQAQGYKVSFNETEPDTNSSEPTNQTVDVNEKVDYNCKPGVAGTVTFELPSGVEFKAIDEMMREAKDKMMEGASDLSSQCSVCDSLTGESKTQCLTALNCN